MKPKPIILSPPFGSFLNFSQTTSICGTYTWKRRPGFIPQLVKTLRLTDEGWVSRPDFHNKGIRSVSLKSDRIYSITAFSLPEWRDIVNYLPQNVMIELSFGDKFSPTLTPPQRVIEWLLEKTSFLSIKLPPDSPLQTFQRISSLHAIGVQNFHLFNTFTTKKGGLSGPYLKNYTLPSLQYTKERLPHLSLIGGGGIQTLEDILEYKQAGADYFSLSSIWFNPLKAMKLLDAIKQ